MVRPPGRGDGLRHTHDARESRTFISVPAGVARMDLKRFVLYSFLGALPWNLALALLG